MTIIVKTKLQFCLYFLLKQSFSPASEYRSTLKAPVTTAADDIHKYFFIVFQRKRRLDVSSKSSARQRIHRKNQALVSSKDKSIKLKCRLLQFLFGALRFKYTIGSGEDEDEAT